MGKAMKQVAAPVDDAAPVLKAMKARKAKQLTSTAPGKFAKTTLGAKRTNDRKKKVEKEEVLATRKAELEDTDAEQEDTSASDDDSVPRKKVMKTMKAMKAMKAGKVKQVKSIAPGKFAKKTLGAKRTKDKTGHKEEEIVAARMAELKAMNA